MDREQQKVFLPFVEAEWWQKDFRGFVLDRDKQNQSEERMIDKWHKFVREYERCMSIQHTYNNDKVLIRTVINRVEAQFHSTLEHVKFT